MNRALRPDQEPDLPTLTDEIVENEGLLSIMIGAFMGSNRRLARREAEVLRRQAQLRDAIDDDEVWQDFLALDNATTDRLSDLLILIATWAYYQGVRVGRRRGADQ